MCDLATLQQFRNEAELIPETVLGQAIYDAIVVFTDSTSDYLRNPIASRLDRALTSARALDHVLGKLGRCGSELQDRLEPSTGYFVRLCDTIDSFRSMVGEVVNA